MRQPMAVWSAVLVFALLRAVYSMSGGSILYYTDGSKINRVDNSSNSGVTVITTPPANPPYSIDCNSCDNKLYWASQADSTINRGTPSLNDNEVIVSLDLERPVGVAVDWRSNTVYYSDDRGVNMGRVEVVTCDGQYRRVLVDGISSVGPLAIDVLRGYMYWIDGSTIMRAWLDGTNPAPLTTVASPPSDITVDYSHERLYWVAGGQLARSHLNGSFIESNLLDARAVSVSNNVLFWLDSMGFIRSHIFPLNDNSSTPSSLPQPSEPRDITSFMQISVSGGCSVSNGGCEMLCFTIPSSSPPYSTSRCGCTTGLQLKSDGKSCVAIPDKFLLFIQHDGQAGNIHRSMIMRLSLDSQDPLERIPVPLNISITAEARAIAYNLVHHKVYWTEVDPPRIMRADHDGTQCEVLVTSSLFAPEGIAVDYRGETLYWADSKLDRIEAMSLRDGQPRYRRVITETSDSNMLRHPRGLALDEQLGRLVWSDFSRAAIEQYHFNSSQRTLLLNNALVLPGPVAIRPSDRRIYGADLSRIFYYTGSSSPNTVLTGDLNLVHGLAFIGDDLYWSERHAIKMAPDTEVAVGLNGVTGLVAVDTSAPVYESCSHDNGDCDDFCIVIGSSEHVCACRENYHVTGTTMCTPDNDPLLFLSNSTNVYMWRGSSAGWPVSTPQWVILPIAATALEFDTRSRTLYWISANDGYIYRAVIDENNVTALTTVSVVTCCYDAISDIAVDWWGRNLYWTDRGRGLIGVAKLDGTGQQVLAEGLDQPDRLVINPYKSVIYYTSRDKIHSVAMDSNLTTPPITIWSNSSLFPIQGLVFDTKDRFLFWSYTKCVYEYRTEVTGSAPVPVYCDTDNPLKSLHVTAPSLLTYYSDNLFILIRAGAVTHVFKEDEHMPPGEGSVTFFIGNISVNDFIITDSSLQQDVHPCIINNGECMASNEAICLVSSPSDRECRCPPTMFLKRSFSAGTGCSDVCTDPDTFLLISTSDTIYHLPINVSATSEQCPAPPIVPRPLPLGVVDNVMGVAYDSVNGGVVWIEGGVNGSVSTALINGSNRRVLTTYTSSITPLSLTYDSDGGHVFWSNTSGTQIELVSYTGGQGVMLTQHSAPVLPTVRIPIAMDTSSRLLYYSDPFSRSINKLNLDTGSISAVSRPRSAAQLLAVDRGSFCWYEESLQAVQLCHSGSTSAVANGTLDQFTALSMVSLDSGIIIFWFNQSSNSLYQYSSGSARIIATMSTMVTGMSAHHNTDTSTILHRCASVNRTCSHLCNPERDECSCPRFSQLDSDMKTCLPISCPGGLHACSDNSSCIPATHLCDNINDCLDGSDERDCECNPQTEFFCYNSSGTKCVPNADKCNDANDCTGGEDESGCDCASTVRCYIDSDLFRCIPTSWINDGVRDCKNGADERGSSTISVLPTVTAVSSTIALTTPTSAVPPHSNTVVITTSTVLAFSVLVVAIVMFVMCQCILSRRYRQASNIHHDHTSSIKTSSSPQMHSDFSSYSITSTSINSEDTRSTTVPHDSNDMYIKRRPPFPFPNPPNSPNRSSFMAADARSFDQDSVLMKPCPGPPNPSINPSVFSDNMSSVSQRRYTGSYHRRVAPAYHHQPHIVYQQAPHPPPHHYSHHYQPTQLQHTMPSLVPESDNISENSYMSQQTGDYADTSFIDQDESVTSTADCYCDSAPPPSLVTGYSIDPDVEDDFT